MVNNLDLIKKELKLYGIHIIDRESCVFIDNDKKYKAKIETIINYFKNRCKKNSNLINELLLDLCNQQKLGNIKYIDENTYKIFIESAKELYKFVSLLSDNTSHRDFIVKNDILKKIRSFLDVDCKCFNKDFVFLLISTKVTLDWIFRKNSKLIYVGRLVNIIRTSKENKLRIVEAAGVAGPWSNLDLPMQERMFSWDDIAEDVESRGVDKKNQQRYRAGLENYNRTDKFGEGYYFREMKNEPYLWSDRKEQSPYVTMNEGTWR